MEDGRQLSPAHGACLQAQRAVRASGCAASCFWKGPRKGIGLALARATADDVPFSSISQRAARHQARATLGWAGLRALQNAWPTISAAFARPVASRPRPVGVQDGQANVTAPIFKTRAAPGAACQTRTPFLVTSSGPVLPCATGWVLTTCWAASWLFSSRCFHCWTPVAGWCGGWRQGCSCSPSWPGCCSCTARPAVANLLAPTPRLRTPVPSRMPSCWQ